MSLFRFLDHHGVGREVYNETITVFWMRLIQEFLSGTDRQQSLVQATNNVLEQFSNSRLIFEYYTEDLVRSQMAKESWVEPDLKPLG
jgi:undecaprenyl pyrophosphate synthase